MSDNVICIFSYNRPQSINALLSDLSKMDWDKSWHFIFFQDASKSLTNDDQVTQCLDCIKSSDIYQRHKTTLVVRDKNYGLKKNIMTGMQYVVSHFDRNTIVLFLEDDLRLDENLPQLIKSVTKKVDWDHINLWSPFTGPDKSLLRIYNCGFMMCWGWVTRVSVLEEFLKSGDYDQRYDFKAFLRDYLGLGLLGRQKYLNKVGKINTWAVFWALFLLNTNKKIIGFDRSFVKNEGIIGGTNCDNDLMQVSESKKNFSEQLGNCIEVTWAQDFSYRLKLGAWFASRMAWLIRAKVRGLFQ